MPQMGPLPWMIMFFSVFCLVLSFLVLVYFTNTSRLVKKNQIVDKIHLWVW